MSVYVLLAGALGVWRLTHLLWGEDGPWDLLARLRRRAGDGFWGNLLDCFFCCSVWVALPFALLLGSRWQDRLLLWPALSAGAILLQGLAFPRTLETRASAPALPPAPFTEDEEPDDVLLRRQETPVPGLPHAST